MGQKVNPISLRLPSPSKTYSDSWYSKHDYSRLFLKKLQVENYIQKILGQKGFPEGQVSLAASSGSHRYLISFLDPRESRKFKGTRYRLPRMMKPKLRPLSHVVTPSNVNIFKNPVENLFQKENVKRNIIPQRTLLNKTAINFSDVLKNICLSGIQNPGTQQLVAQYAKMIQDEKQLKSPSSQKKALPSKSRKANEVQGISSSLNNVIESYSKTPSTLSLWSNRWESQHADFLAQEIALALVNRVSFRTIKSQLLKEIEENYKNQWGAVRGLRITCSGRASKKSQRAQTLRFQWGQTSLHTFAEKIGYGCRSALTTFGQTGVKVWICYK
jgi:ribosomal protein S3